MILIPSIVSVLFTGGYLSRLLIKKIQVLRVRKTVNTIGFLVVQLSSMIPFQDSHISIIILLFYECFSGIAVEVVVKSFDLGQNTGSIVGFVGAWTIAIKSFVAG